MLSSARRDTRKNLPAADHLAVTSAAEEKSRVMSRGRFAHPLPASARAKMLLYFRASAANFSNRNAR